MSAISTYQCNEKHLQEWNESGVDPEITKLNVHSISGIEVIQQLGIEDYSDYALRKYAEVIKGGWVVAHIYKPDIPRVKKPNDKPVKYENKLGFKSNPVIKLQLPEKTWQAIADKWNIKKSPEQDGWEWVEENPSIPISVVEGVKKAGCVITQLLIPCLALPGHTNAYKKAGELNFEEFVHEEREIFLGFDRDITMQARSAVASTIRGVINRIVLKGEVRAKLKICQWAEGKGLDDVWLLFGRKKLQEIFDAATTWFSWVDDSFNALGFKPQITFNSPKFKFIELHPETHLIGVIGRKGCGKTWYSERLVEQAKQNKRPVLLCVHRIQLAIANSKRLGIDYIENLEKKVSDVKQVSLVIDSLWKVDPQKFAGGLFIVDEVVQTLEHLMTSSTCRSKRQKIIKALREIAKVLIQTNGQFVLLDADLNEATLRFFMGLLGDNIEPFIIQNTYSEPSYECFISEGLTIETKRGNIQSPADVVATALSYAKAGKRVLFLTTGQDEISRWGTINLEKLFLELVDFKASVNGSGIIRIDSETTKNPEHLAFKATSRINQLCDSSQVVLCSPTAQTGISIENMHSFDLVVGLFSGVGSPDGVRQFLMRLRDIEVPRLIYVADEGLSNEFNYLGSSPQKVKNEATKLYNYHVNELNNFDKEWCGEFPEVRFCNTTSEYFANLVSTRNKEIEEFKKYVEHGLKLEKVRVKNINTASDVFECSLSPENIHELSDKVRKNSVAEYRQRLEACERLTEDTYQKLSNKIELTDTEREAYEAEKVAKRYHLSVTQELLEKDSEGWFAKLRLHYIASSGFEITEKINALAANNQVQTGLGSIIQHDFITRQKMLVQAKFVKKLKLLDLVNSDALVSNRPEFIETYQELAKLKKEIELIFGENLSKYPLSPEKFDFTIFQKLYERMDIKAKCSGKPSVDGKRYRKYSVTIPDDERQFIFEKWLAEDTKKALAWDARKRENEIVRLAKTCTVEIDKERFELLSKHEWFAEIWERVDTGTRIKIINRFDNFELPNFRVFQLNPLDVNYQQHLAEIATWTKFAVDLETFGDDAKNKEGLHPRKGQIRLIQISNGKTIYWVDLGGRGSDKAAIQERFKEFLQLLNSLISDPNVLTINHNIHFDLRFLRFRLGFDRARNVADTMKGLQIFFGDYGGLGVLPDGYGLKNGVEKFLGLAVDKTEQKSDWGAPLTQSQIEYAIRDPFITYHLYDRIINLYENPAKFGFGKLQQEGIREAWQLENDVIPCAVEIETNGIPIDRVEAEKILEQCKIIQKNLLNEWTKLVPQFSYTQNSKLKVLLNEKYKLNIAKLDKAKIAEVNDLAEIKLLSKLRAIKIPIQQLESLLRSSEQTGRVQTVLNTLTGTGRFSSGSSKLFNDLPNLQSVSAKAHPSLKEFGLPGVRTVIKPIGKATHVLIDKESALKAQSKYQKLNGHIPEVERDYLRMCHEFFDIVLNLDKLNFIDKVEALAHLQSWQDDKKFTKKYELPNLKGLVKTLASSSMGVIDLAASHGRIAADVADDETAIAGCNDETVDNHSKVAVHVAKALNQDVDWEEIKDGAKSGNAAFKLFRDAAKNTYYGWLNGAGAKRVQEQIKANSGQIVSLEACEGAIKGCEVLYPKIVDFRKNLIDTLSNKNNLLHVDGKYYAVNKIESVKNRITHLVTVEGEKVDLPYTQCLAAIWSRTEATALKRALILITELADTRLDWNLKVINYVHDEINIEFNTEYVEEIVTKVNNIIGDCFQATMAKVKDGRETNWTKLVVENWSQK